MEKSGSSSDGLPQTLLHPSFFSDALSSVWVHMKDVKKNCIGEWRSGRPEKDI